MWVDAREIAVRRLEEEAEFRRALGQTEDPELTRLIEWTRQSLEDLDERVRDPVEGCG